MPLSDRDRRAVKIGGILAAVLIVALLAIGQLGKGGTEALPPLAPSTGSPTTGPATGPTGPSGPTGGPTTAPSTAPPSAVFNGRDPFSPPPIFATQVPPTSPGGPTGPTGATGPTSGPPGPTGPTTGPPPTTSGPTSQPTAPSNGSSTTVGGHTVVILDTFTENGQQMATIEVDGTVYHVAEGDTFAGGDFQLVSVSGNCAALLFGDESFTLCFTPEK